MSMSVLLMFLQYKLDLLQALALVVMAQQRTEGWRLTLLKVVDENT